MGVLRRVRHHDYPSRLGGHSPVFLQDRDPGRPALYAGGALLTIPASTQLSFNTFLVGFYVLTFGLAFLETAANPYILSLGPPETATRRLNLAQAFNPIGSLTGMIVASMFVLPDLDISSFRDNEIAAHPEYTEMLPSDADEAIGTSWQAFVPTDSAGFQAVQSHDLRVVMIPYAIIAAVVIITFILFAVTKLPDTGHDDAPIKLGALTRHLLGSKLYVGGVIAQAFYVSAQIMCWTFIIHCGMTLCGLTASQAQNYNIAAMVRFLSSRFSCTLILRIVQPGRLLMLLALGGLGLTCGAIVLQGMPGLYCLIGVSGCMSLMFPTIYGIALDGLTPSDAKLGSAGLIFAIVGGAIMPRLQGSMIDGDGWTLGSWSLESVRVSFLLPAICFVVIAIYGAMVHKLSDRSQTTR
ncbi:MAG: L-fucose:H+ symporter permease [Candidatus Synoicihabitans palmerolidicus]|nr:L-fucose:H+ symporter permease [Candidatus Synoicihabitans palmerolidicus]